MKIVIDGNEANFQQRVGVHQYAYEILWGLYGLEKTKGFNNQYTICLSHAPINDLPRENNNWKYKILPGNNLWILTRLLPHVWVSNKYDVLFSPNHYLPLFTIVPQVFTIHDLGYLKYKGQFKKYDYWQLKCWTAMSLYISKYIITVSQYSKNDIVRHYPSASKKVNVIHHGYDSKRFNTNISANVVRRVKEKYKIKGDYLLFLSTLKPSKNVEGIVEAYKLLKDKGVKDTLVIGGKKGWLFDSIYEKVKVLRLESEILFTDFIDEEDKAPMILGSKALISPSHWEGFGMHVVESLACGTPVIVSRVASLPEVVGDAGIYVDNNDVSDIAAGMEELLGLNPKEYNKLVGKGLKQVRKYSWNKAAKETLGVFEKAVS